jgi:WD40 repeat protein
MIRNSLAAEVFGLALLGLVVGHCPAEEPRLRAALGGHTDWVYCVAFSPRGKLIASGSKDKSIKLWDGETGQNMATFQGHTGHICSLAYSPDGRMLASGDNNDKTI